MSLATTTNKVVYTGSGITGPYSFSFPIFAATDLVVTRYTIADGTETTFVLNTDYTVAGSFTSTSPASGSITLVSTLSSSYKLIIQRVLAYTQPVDLQPNDDLPADTIEKSIADRIVMLVQQVKEVADRTITSDISTTEGFALPFPVSDNLIGWNTAADNLENKVIADIGATELASQAEAEAGSNNTKFMSPLRVSQAITALTPADSVTASNTVTLTNKRITKRVGTTTSSATPTINTDSYDMYTITALAAAITSFTTNLSGTPTTGQQLIIRIKDDGTARAITWGASFASRGATLPTTTVISKTMYVGLIWNEVASVWDCIATAQEV